MDENAVIIGDGAFPPVARLRKILREASLVVCANGGARHALRLGLKPDIVIGDLDSLPLSMRRRLKHASIIQWANQNLTDLEKALLFLLRRRVKRITILGATGKRIDQTLANIALLNKYHRRARLTLIDSTGQLEIVQSKAKLRAARGEMVSLLPIGRTVGVRTRGLLYPLRNEALKAGTRGVSNKATGRTVEITLQSGRLLLVRLF